ncbi:MAG: Hpt domain-containing protein [Phycisphaerales bacterium]|nr:Hpt domain-containing protein [bacterium]
MNAPDPNAFSLDINDPEDAELIEYFLSELPTRVDTIMAAFTNDDFQGLARIAHQLKGAAPGFGFPQIGVQAAKLEQQIKGVADPTESLETLRSEVDQLVSLCNSYINPA